MIVCSPLRRSLLWSCLLWVLAAAGCGGGSGGGSEGGGPEPSQNLATWLMHPIDSRFRGASGLGVGDVNGDGLRDYVTSYELDQRYVVTLHPGIGAPLRRPWPSVVAFVPEPLTVAAGVNPQAAVLGDFDGDGNVDVAAAQGFAAPDREEIVGTEPGVRIVWGPSPAAVVDPTAWLDAGRIPATWDRGHFNFLRATDVDRDGALDIVAVGRTHGGNGRKAGLIWIEAPEDPGRRRDLNEWIVHEIDAQQSGGHGFALHDVDEDRDLDIVLVNADSNTPQVEEAVVWYENPGLGFVVQREPWPRNTLLASSEFSAKPQVAVGDLDGDGRGDILTQTRTQVLWFRKTNDTPVAFDLVRIEKPPSTVGLSQAIQVADLNDDGRLDILVLGVHEDGLLSGARAAAFWLEYSGDSPTADNWRAHVIKWGSGLTMDTPGFGERWDEVDVVDVDGDGDLDFVASCAEWFEAGVVRSFTDQRAGSAIAAVRWFENRVNEPRVRYGEREGAIVVEAETYSNALDGSWVARVAYPGFGGDGFLQDIEVLDRSARGFEATGGVDYSVQADGGAYYVWVRRQVPLLWGRGLGRSSSDSAWIGIDGAPIVDPLDDAERELDVWLWTRAPSPVALDGPHTLNLRAREGGYAVDRIILTTDPGFVPAGVGPPSTRIE